ncbi:MAG TPA: hypothetical protein VNA67_05940 [Pseudonocardiaceae bacterium]|nr:hypothetical protein [Pseudonocardiaceae bacterium]
MEGVGPSTAILSIAWISLIAPMREAGWCVVVISGETAEGVMFYAVGFGRVGVVMGELYFVGPDPLPARRVPSVVSALRYDWSSRGS